MIAVQVIRGTFVGNLQDQLPLLQLVQILEAMDSSGSTDFGVVRRRTNKLRDTLVRLIGILWRKGVALEGNGVL